MPKSWNKNQVGRTLEGTAAETKCDGQWNSRAGDNNRQAQTAVESTTRQQRHAQHDSGVGAGRVDESRFFLEIFREMLKF